MLERTATSIEPCSSSLQRVFPSTRSCLQSRRKLHTAFWHHGAAEFELLDACQALIRLPPAEPKAHAVPAKPTSKWPDTMTASTFLLEFLYPRGTAALLRRPYRIHPASHESASRARNPVSRLFTSAVAYRSGQSSNSQVASEEPASIEDPEEEYHIGEEQAEQEHGAARDDAGEAAEDQAEMESPEALRSLLDSPGAGAYDQIFQLYTRLKPGLKGGFTTDVLLAISPSTRPIEAWRVNELFALYHVDDWTEALVRAAVKAQLTLHNVPEAMSIFKTAVERRGLGQALDYLVAYGFELSSWDMVLEGWALYLSIKVQQQPVFEPPAEAAAAPAAQLTEVRDTEHYAETTGLLDAGSGVGPPESSTALSDTEVSVKSPRLRDAAAVAQTVGLPEKEPFPGPTIAHKPEHVAGSTTPQDAKHVGLSAAEQSTKAAVESRAAQDAEVVTDPATVLVVEPVSESAPVQAAEVEATQTTGQPAGNVAEATTAGNTESEVVPMAAHNAEPGPESSDSTPVKDADSTADLAAGQVPQLDLASNPATVPSADPGFALPTLAAAANFEAKVRELDKFIENDTESKPQRIALVDAFLTHLLRHSMNLFRTSDVVFMLDRVKDPQSYERCIISNVEQERKKLAGDLYKKYRALPQPRVPDSVLRTMIDVFFPHNVVGMEQLLEDWYRGYGRLDERAYRKFMAFYGGRGDVKSIKRLAGEYSRHYNSKVEEDPEFVTTLMQAHAVRGDPHAARRVLEEAAERSGEPPVIKQWNILMNAHTKAGDYGGAIDLFSNICNEYEPDHYTFATIMGMAGFRGDLQFTLELFQLAKDWKVQPTVAMMRALVEAYCQNDRFTEAESLCVGITKKREMAGDYTLLWNALLRHNARRRNLTTVNRLLEFMSSQGIAYNQETYSQLLLVLLYARQSHHAMHLLRVAQREGVFEPTADHFILLMAAFINSGEPHMALKTNELMAKMNYPHSAMRMTKVIDALGRWQELPASKRRGSEGEHFLKHVLRGFYKAMEKEDQGSPDDIRSVISLYSKVLFVLTQMRQFATVQQIIRLHNSRYPGRATRETIPLKLLHQIMLADFFEKKYDAVKETWSIILERSSKRYAPASTHFNPGDPNGPPKPVVYAQRFRLCDPLKTMQRLYLELHDAGGLIDLIATVRGRGFDLDSKNWNYHVQALARLKKWREAFTTCEHILMPQWAGWYAVRAEGKVKNQLPLELRRVGANPQRPRPIAHTLLVLAKEYMDLEQMMLWSSEASREFEFITAECPKTVRAVTTMHRSDSRLETRIFGEEPAQEGGQEHVDGTYLDQGPEVCPELGLSQPRGQGGVLQEQDDIISRRRRERNVSYDDVWTDGGFFKVSESVPKTKKGHMSEKDIVSALKGKALDEKDCPKG